MSDTSAENGGLRGPSAIRTRKRGIWLLKNPATNKGTAFTPEERDRLGLHGLLPAGQLTIEQQVELELAQVRAKANDLEKYISLIGLLHRNEVLFYRVLVEHLEELMPIVYTPTVGEACQRYSHIVRHMRGLWLSPDDVGDIPARLRSYPYQDIRLIVVTDNERILGLGDLGAGGMGIPVGKLALYVAGAGIHPSKVLPVSLDLGTENAELLEDPLYIGHRARRLRGDDYARFVDAFVDAVSQVFPRAVLQWEDFAKQNAFHNLETYRSRLPSFNDDIQGTAGVAVAGVLAALRITGQSIADQRILFMGAGEACTGIAQLLESAMLEEGVPLDRVRASRLMFDSRGLLRDDAQIRDPHKKAFAAGPDALAAYGLEGAERPTPADVIARMKPTVLIGATAQPGTFTREMIEEMARHVERPIVMPLSNPTSRSECSAKEAINWSDGRALVATGSPFADVEHAGTRHVIGQGNNVFIFPGVGMGALVSGLREIDDSVFLVAARALADFVSPERLAQGALYPSQSELRAVSQHVATAVVRHASARGQGRGLEGEQAARAVAEASWWPEYVPVERISD